MAMAASRARALYGRKGYRPQSQLNRSYGDIMLKRGRQEAAGVPFNLFPQIGAHLPFILGDIVRETTENIAAKANASAPVRTGRMRDSQRVRYSHGKSGAIVSGRIDYKAIDPTAKEPKHEYAFLVNTRAQPFLLPALIDERSEFNRKLRNLESRMP